MTYNVLMGTLNPTHSLTVSSVWCGFTFVLPSNFGANSSDGDAGFDGLWHVILSTQLEYCHCHQSETNLEEDYVENKIFACLTVLYHIQLDNFLSIPRITDTFWLEVLLLNGINDEKR